MTTEPDLSFLSTPEWQAFIFQAEMADPAKKRAFEEFMWNAYISDPVNAANWNAFINGAGGGPTVPGAQPTGQPFAGTPITGTANTAGDSAVAILRGALRDYGLESLGNQVWDWWKQGRPIEQIMLDMEETPEWIARFPAMKTLAQKGMALSPQQYIDLERGYTELARKYGLPPGFYDQHSDFTKLIEGEVSTQEWDSRLQMYQMMAFDTDPTARAELNRLYGINEGAIAALFADPTRAMPILQRMVGSSLVGASARQAGFGLLSQGEAELLSDIDPAKALEGFDQLVQLREVLNVLPGEVGQGVSRQSALAGIFQGDQAAREDIQRRADRRKAVFQGGGSYERSDTGYTGVG